MTQARQRGQWPSNVNWAEIRRQALDLRGSLIWTVAQGHLRAQSALHTQALHDRKATIDEIRYAQGYEAAMAYATMIIEKVWERSTRATAKQEKKNGT